MKNKSFIIVLLFFIFTTFSVAFSAKESEKFKVVIGSDEDIRISDVRLGVSIANVTNRTNDSKQYGVSDYQYYIISGSSIEFDRPSDTFILTIDEDTLPVGYEVDENNVFIDEETNIYKFEVVRKKGISSLEHENFHNFNDECRIREVDANDISFYPQNRNLVYANQGRFYVYYDSALTNGSLYASEVLDYIDDIESFFGYYGFATPSSDSSNNYYIYLKSNNEIGGVNGETTPEVFGRSTIAINLDLFGISGDSDAFVSTLAHEYFHASVFATDGGLPMGGGWFSEACATAVGLYFVSENNIQSNKIRTTYKNRFHYYYIDSKNGIDNSNDRYNNFIFPYYLIQEIGLDFIEELYEMQLGRSIELSDLDNVLSTMYTSLAEEHETMCKYNLDPANNYDVISYYTTNWSCESNEHQPSVHNALEYSSNTTFSIEDCGSEYISMKAYEGYGGCSDYEGIIALVFDEYQDVTIFEGTVSSSGSITYQEINVPSEESNIYGGYVVIIGNYNLGSSSCEELRYVISNCSGGSVSCSCKIKIKHRIPQIYESFNVTFGSILNDLRLLKFTPIDTGLYQFDLSTNGNTLANEIVIEDDNLLEIDRFSVGGISVGAHNNSFVKSITCYLEEGEIYYISVINDSSVVNHSMTVNRSFDTLYPDAYNPFGVSNYYFTKGDKLFTFTVPQTGNYTFTFSINFNLYYDMYFVVYKENAYGLSLEDYDIINASHQTSTITVSLVQGESVYVGYYNYRGGESSVFNLIVSKI